MEEAAVVVAAGQPLTALLDANMVRSHRAQLKREFKARTTDPVRVLMELPRSCEKVHAIDYLTWVPRIGKTRAKVLCRRARLLTPELELRKLGPDTRLRLAHELHDALARHA